MAETGTTQLEDSCFVPGITFHGIRTPSWDSSSRNSAIFGILNSFFFCFPDSVGNLNSRSIPVQVSGECGCGGIVSFGIEEMISMVTVDGQ